MSKPPRIMQAALSVLLPPDRREQVLGDLEEEYRAAPPSQALGNYMRDVLSLLPSILGSQVGAWFAIGPAAPGLVVSAGIDRVRHQIETFQRDNHSRLTFYSTMCAAMMTVFVWLGLRATAATPRIFLATFVAVLAFTVWQHYRRGCGRIVPARASMAELIDFHRNELERRKEFLLTLWYWKFAPMLLPMLIALAIGPNPTLRGLVTMLSGFAVAHAAARKQVAALEQRIEELR